jgi:hypothetical protein
MNAPDLVSLNRGQAAATRKVAALLGPSRNPLKVRIALWQHGPRRWSTGRAEWRRNVLGPAPSDWPQTRAAQQALAAGRWP